MTVGKIIFFCIIFVLACLGSYYVEPSKIKTDSLSAICTIFSVLAGLILAIYALHISSIDYTHNMPNHISDAIVWDSEKAINRLSYFFYLYLIVLSLSFIVILGQSIDIKSDLLCLFFHYSAKSTVFFSIFAGGMSFFVPIELKYIQERKVLEAKKKQSSQFPKT